MLLRFHPGLYAQQPAQLAGIILLEGDEPVSLQRRAHFLSVERIKVAEDGHREFYPFFFKKGLRASRGPTVEPQAITQVFRPDRSSPGREWRPCRQLAQLACWLTRFAALSVVAVFVVLMAVARPPFDRPGTARARRRIGDRVAASMAGSGGSGRKGRGLCGPKRRIPPACIPPRPGRGH